MKYFNKLAGIAALVLAVGCAQEPGMTKTEDKGLESLSGKPISVSIAGGNHNAKGLSLVLQKEDGKYQLCHTVGVQFYLSDMVDMAALIQSEIADGDNDSVKLNGKYKDGIFKIYSAEANGMKVEANY